MEHLGAALENEPLVASELEHFPRKVIEEVKPTIKNTDGKLVVAEEIAEGHVTWKSVKLYLSGLGGDYLLIFFSIWISASFLTDWMDTFQVWFLEYWGTQYETHAPSEVDAFVVRLLLYLKLAQYRRLLQNQLPYSIFSYSLCIYCDLHWVLHLVCLWKSQSIEEDQCFIG